MHHVNYFKQLFEDWRLRKNLPIKVFEKNDEDFLTECGSIKKITIV